MNALSIYLVTTPSNHSPDYDCTRSAVVIASSPEEAKGMVKASPMLFELYPSTPDEIPTPNTNWDIDRAQLVVMQLGSARLGAIPGVVCEDNRGA